MTSITTLLKNTLTLNCYLLTQTVLLMKQNQKMFMKNFLSIDICLTLVTIQKIQILFNQANKKNYSKIIDESKEKIIDEFVELRSKMHSMKNIDGKESNVAKGVNIATEVNEFKDTLFNKKLIRYKMRRIQGKKHKMGAYKINKISTSVFDGKRFILIDSIHTLAYFHKDLKHHRRSQIKISVYK